MNHTQGTVVTGIFASRACPVELYSTDTADIFLWHVPAP